MTAQIPLTRIIFALMMFAALVSASGATTGRGVYVDAAGGRHPWSINGAHTLVWDNKPFVPVGGLFVARSWSGAATEADFAADVAALTLLRAHSITDIYVQPAQGGLTDIKPDAIQRLLNELDRQNFTYGISINDGPRDIMTGYVVRPGAYRQLTGDKGAALRFPVSNLASSLYFIATETSREVLVSGSATVSDSGAQVTPPSNLPGQYAVFLVPRRVYPSLPGSATNRLGLPDLWSGFDAYRDNLIALFKQVHLGKGFRFFVDALPSNLSLTEGESEHLIPSGAGFQNEWGAWLVRRYRTIDNITTAWGMADRDFAEVGQVAGLLPLWGGGKGLEAFHDLATGKQYRVNTQRSAYWNDLAQFKAESVRGYMNDLATILKKTVADVPVVYRSSGYSPLFAIITPSQGFDGVGFEAYGRGNDLVLRSAAQTYAQASQSPRPLWLPVIATADTDPSAVKTATGYASSVALSADMGRLREIGARGFYVSSVHAPDTQKDFDLARTPQQLDWLANAGQAVQNGGVAAAPAPFVLFYPRGLTGISPRELAPAPGGTPVWWLPTDSVGVAAYDFGPAGRGYALSEDTGTVFYLYNPAGPRRVHIAIPKASRLPGVPPVGWSREAGGEVKQNTLALTIGPDPVRITNLASLPVPTEAFGELLSQATALTKAMRRRNMLEAGRYELGIAGVKSRYNRDQPIGGVNELRGLISDMEQMLRTYTWIEAESGQHTFDEAASRVGASGGQVLTVDARADGLPAATARYTISVAQSGPCELWVAASPHAPLTFRLDDQALLDEATIPRPVGEPFAGGSLVWIRYGVATLPKGKHVLEMRASGPATVDTLLLTTEPFTPAGTNPPPVKP